MAGNLISNHNNYLKTINLQSAECIQEHSVKPKAEC